ncbi:hypothetical protein AB0J27_03925 [Micromonospora chokoriensis]
MTQSEIDRVLIDGPIPAGTPVATDCRPHDRVKWLLDVLFAATALLFLSAVLLLVTVTATLGRPVLFRQTSSSAGRGRRDAAEVESPTSPFSLKDTSRLRSGSTSRRSMAQGSGFTPNMESLTGSRAQKNALNCEAATR